MPGIDSDDKSSGGALNEHHGQGHQDNRQHSQAGGYPGGTVSAHDDAIARNGGGDNGSQKTATSQPVEHGPTIQRAGRAVAITNSVLALATIGTLIVTAFQLNSMNGQLKQMKIANEFTKNAVEASIRQANAAENANNIARQALLSDRAWVSMQDTSVVGSIANNTRSEFLLKYVNNGKAIARKFGVYHRISYYNTAIAENDALLSAQASFAEECMKSNDTFGNSLVYPNINGSGLQIQMAWDLKENADYIIAGTKGIMLLSCAVYITEGSVKHASSCRRYHHNVTNPVTLSLCNAGDDTD